MDYILCCRNRVVIKSIRKYFDKCFIEIKVKILTYLQLYEKVDWKMAYISYDLVDSSIISIGIS